MKKSKFSLLLILTLVFSLFLAACSGDKSSKTDEGNGKGGNAGDVAQEIKAFDQSEIPTMDTSLAEGSTSFTYINNVGEGLYRLDQDNKPVPALSDGEPTISDDQTVYTFKIRDAKWSNGDPITAHDFVYAWQRAIDPKTASPYGPYMMSGKIKGAQAITDAASAEPPKPYDVKSLGVVAKDDKTLEVTFEQPIPYWADLFAFPTFYPINEKFVKEKGEAYATNKDNLLYNGPFVMTDWDGPSDTEWVLEKNENYWDIDAVKLTKMTFNSVKDPASAVNAFEAGEVDITAKLSSDLVQQYQGDDRLVNKLEKTVFWLKMNQTGDSAGNKAFQNVNIRRAIAQGFDKEAFVASVLNNGSLPANGQMPKEFVTDPVSGKDWREVNGDLIKYDAEAAKASWEKGLKELGIKELEVRFLGDDTENAKKTAEYFKNQLEKNLPGLTLKVESVPFAVRLERDNAQDYDLQVAGWGPDFRDPMTFSDLFVTGGGSNRMGYSNPEYDKLIKTSLTQLGGKPEEYYKSLLQAEKILLEQDAAIAPIYQRNSAQLMATKVKDVAAYDYGPDYCYKWTSVAAE
ncbi:peptide ABC transporter substrate-binding protein [Peribacillus saganii]|uniref:Peptide ABC transporter substrate-binding protein n=1 Tax=Peribacillus saganii TaxID=2303992 RepID=A0A372LNV9_9BACI|nr:peptide ABC transporter substrate-binding protein [Peribacillus saganii]RFU68026.1 peptide ABC transporter substrate-binding protein [Peribacillus saganii]